MLHLVENLQFQADISFVSENSSCFRSSGYPPKDEFVMSINSEAEVVSRYGDDTWDFTHFGLTQKFKFKEYDEANKSLFKQLMYYVIYSYLFPGKYSSLAVWYQSYQYIFRACSEAKIKASELSRYPKVLEDMTLSYARCSPSKFEKSIHHFHAVLRNQEQIGFKLLDEKGIAAFKKAAPEYENGQTPYIPHRIWTKFIQHLDSVLDDFLSHQKQLEKLYFFLARTSLVNEKNGVPSRDSSPFSKGRLKGKKYYSGSFENYLTRNGLTAFFEKYVERPTVQSTRLYKVDQFGSLLNNVVVSCFLYILYYSIMRKNEALSLRVDCFQVENDEQLGNYYLLKGETTKTEIDSDARWVVPKRVERAVNIAKMLVSWKLQFISAPTETPYLFQTMNVWQAEHRNSNRRFIKSLDNVFEKAACFFRPNRFEITTEDYDEALALTPSLVNSEWFKVGEAWKFAHHQFRRTLAVHFALNKVSSSSTQLQMKHGTREQQFHYQNNAGRLRLNNSAEQVVVNEYYAEMTRNMESVVFREHVLPHKRAPLKNEVVRFIEDGDKKKLLKAQKNGAVGYRKNLLGGCMKQGPCEYGGFDSVVHCAGGVNGNMCTDLIIDGSSEHDFEEDKTYYKEQMKYVSKDSPRYKALEAEVRAYENVLVAIKRR